MAGLLTKGIKLSYSTSGTSSYTQIPDLMSCPALGGSKEKVDITTLADGAYKYIAGLKTQEDLAFQFLYDNAENGSYRLAKGITGILNWKIEFPDGTAFTFTGECSTAIDAAAVNAALTFTLTIVLNSDITVADPA